MYTVYIDIVHKATYITTISLESNFIIRHCFDIDFRNRPVTHID